MTTDLCTDPTSRLRIATRIHFALLRHYGEDVAVSTLLRGEADAREALWVCQASGHEELVTLGQQFPIAAPAVPAPRTPRSPQAPRRAAEPAEPPAPRANWRTDGAPPALPPRAAVAQDMAWAADTSGFGISAPLGLIDDDTAPLRRRSWLSPARWIGGAR